MATLMQWMADHGLALVFVNVWAEQLGLPVPAYPALIVTGALSTDGSYSAWTLLGTAVLACLLADVAWWLAGRRFGGRVLRTVCRISVSPDSCVRQTESLFARWGVWSLLVAKLIPGFGTIAAVLSGNHRVPLALFLLADAVGALLYAGIGIGLGVVFHDAVDDILTVLANLGRIAIPTLLAALALFIATKWWQRHRMIVELRGTRITVPQLTALLQGDSVPTILDVRPASSRERDGLIPGARVWSIQAPDADLLASIGHDTNVVVYCACPNEASAALVARHLRKAGFQHVRPLHGGIEAWVAAGLPVDRPQPA